jgi:hypothetical protein
MITSWAPRQMSGLIPTEHGYCPSVLEAFIMTETNRTQLSCLTSRIGNSDAI